MRGTVVAVLTALLAAPGLVAAQEIATGPGVVVQPAPTGKLVSIVVDLKPKFDVDVNADFSEGDVTAEVQAGYEPYISVYLGGPLGQLLQQVPLTSQALSAVANQMLNQAIGNVLGKLIPQQIGPIQLNPTIAQVNVQVLQPTTEEPVLLGLDIEQEIATLPSLGLPDIEEGKIVYHNYILNAPDYDYAMAGYDYTLSLLPALDLNMDLLMGNATFTLSMGQISADVYAKVGNWPPEVMSAYYRAAFLYDVLDHLSSDYDLGDEQISTVLSNYSSDFEKAVQDAINDFTDKGFDISDIANWFDTGATTTDIENAVKTELEDNYKSLTVDDAMSILEQEEKLLYMGPIKFTVPSDVPVLGGTELSVPGLDVTMTLIDIEPQISYNFGLPIKLCNFIPEIKIVF
jgi:hypothetical protein